ncbi:MAG: hypothetical protein ABMA64_38635 [Myxococcota bacterium]
MLALTLTFGCRESDPHPPAVVDTGSPFTLDSGSSSPQTGDTGGAEGPGWEHLLLSRAGVAAFVEDAGTIYAVDGLGGLLVVGDPWQDLGVATLDDRGVYAADAESGVVWAASYARLGWWTGGAWSSVELPEELRQPQALVARSDGTAAVLAVYQPTTDCYYSCYPVVTNYLGIWDGAGWSLYQTEPTDQLMDLAETADGTLVAVGTGGWVARWTGSGWEDVAHGDSRTLRGVAADGDGIVAVGDYGYALEGPLDALAPTVTPTDFDAVEIAANGTRWAHGWPNLWVDDGSGWAEVALPSDGYWYPFWPTADGVVVAGDVGGPVALAGDAGGLAEVWSAPSLWWVQDVAVEPDGTAWFAAHSGLGRWGADGTYETWVAPGGGEARAVAGQGTDVIAASDAGVLAWDGASWSLAYDLGDGLVWDVAVAPDGAAYAVGLQDLPDETELPVLLRRDGGVWSVDPAPFPESVDRYVVQVVAFAADDVYALAYSELLRFDGAAWSVVAPLAEDDGALWGRAGDDLYVGGARTPPLRQWDGAVFTPIPTASPVLVLAGDSDDLLVVQTAGWGDAFAPSVSRLHDGAWTLLYESDDFMAVGAAEGIGVVTGGEDAWRGDL